MVKAPPQIETARLVLLPPESRDAETVFQRYASDAEVTRFLSWPRHQSIDDTRAFLVFSAQEWERWPAGPYLIWSRGPRRLLGGTGLAFEAADLVSTGYVLAKDAWGNGYATEALTAMVAVARSIGLRRLTADCHLEHRASRRVLEKCGFVHDAAWSEPAEFPNLAPGVLQPVARYERVLA